MNRDEWIEAAKAFKDLQDRMYGMQLLAANADLREDANPCPVCGKLMVPFVVWKDMSEEIRPAVFAGECSSQGMCASCAGKERAKNKAERTTGPLSDEVVQRLRAAVNFKGKGV